MAQAEYEPNYGELTVSQARAMRQHEARLAASYAYRAAQARARGKRRPAAQWTAAYRESADRCRLLGERIRGELSEPADLAEADAARVGVGRSEAPDPRATLLPQ